MKAVNKATVLNSDKSYFYSKDDFVESAEEFENNPTLKNMALLEIPEMCEREREWDWLLGGWEAWKTRHL